MKLRFTPRALCALLAATLFAACQPQENLEAELAPQTPTEMAVAAVRFADAHPAGYFGDHLRIASLEAWEQLASDSEAQAQVLQLVRCEDDAYISLHEVLHSPVAQRLYAEGDNRPVLDVTDLAEDEFFYQMLNPQGVIELGDYLLRLDLKGEQAWAVRRDASPEALAAWQKSEARHPAVGYYTFEEDIVELLKNDDLGVYSRTEWCDEIQGINDDPLPYKYDSFGDAPCAPGDYYTCHRFKTLTRYFQGGIYYRLYSRSENEKNGSVVFTWVPEIAYIEIEYSYRLEIACGEVRNLNNKIDNNYGNALLEIEYYRGSKKLSDLTLYVTHRFRNDNTNQPVIWNSYKYYIR